MNFQKACLFFSVVACVLSILSIISVNKMQIFINSNDVINHKFQPIKDIPDVEIIKPDGSVEKISASRSQDELSKILSQKKENKNDEKKANPVKKNEFKEVSKVIITNDNKDSKNVISQENKDIKNKQSSEKYIEPVSRKDKDIKSTNKQLKAENSIKSASNVNKNASNENKNLKSDSVVKSRIHGNFVVQVGAFKDRQIAVKQCSNILKHIGKNECDVATTNNKVFRAIVYPFSSYDEALKFANVLSSKTKINCLVKKNA